jgi:putative flippase GtrA
LYHVAIDAPAIASRRVAEPRRTIGARVMHMRSPESGTVGQGVRFTVAGGAVALIYLATTTVLAEVFHVHFQLALIIGTATALVAHFTLQRLFVWVHHEEFALDLHEQLGRYLVIAAVQYGVTAVSTAVLPGALDVPVLPVYIVTALVLAAANFLVFRGGIFHPER